MDSSTNQDLKRPKGKQKKLRENIVINTLDTEAEQLLKIKKYLKEAGLRYFHEASEQHDHEIKPVYSVVKKASLSKKYENSNVWDQLVQSSSFQLSPTEDKGRFCLVNSLPYNIKSNLYVDSSIITANYMPKKNRKEGRAFLKKKRLHAPLVPNKETLDCYPATKLESLNIFMKAVLDLMQESKSVVINSTSNQQDSSVSLSLDFKHQDSNQEDLIQKRDTIIDTSNEHQSPSIIMSEYESTQSNLKSYLEEPTLEAFMYEITHTLSSNTLHSDSEDSFKTCISRQTYNRMPSVRYTSWHFLDIMQGYLLTVLLRWNNINILHMIRNAYYVIITVDAPNLILQMNFALKDKPLLEDLQCTCGFSIVENWNDHTGKILLQKIHQCLTKVVPKQKTSVGAFAMAQDSEATLRAEFCELCHRPQHSQQCTGVGSGILVGGRKSAATTTLLFYSYISQKQKITKHASVGRDSVTSFSEHFGIYKMLHSYCKPIFRKSTCNYTPRTPYTPLSTPKTSCYSSSVNVNEVLSKEKFMGTTLQRVINICMNPNFYSVFFKCMGHTVGCTLLSVILSILS